MAFDYAEITSDLTDMKRSGIYCIKNIANNRLYIGSAFELRLRWNGHKSLLNKSKHHSPVLQSAWDKYGSNSFEFVIVEYVDDKNDLIGREQYWIDFFLESGRLYNTCLIAGNTLGFKHSDEAKQKISAASKSMIRTEEHYRKVGEAQKGKIISDEQRQKIRATLTGKTLTEEHKKNMSIAMKGKTHSEETRAKMSKIQNGKVMSDDAKKKMSESALIRWGNSTEEQRMACGRPGHKQSQETIAKRVEKLRGKKMPHGFGLRIWEKRRANMASKANVI